MKKNFVIIPVIALLAFGGFAYTANASIFGRMGGSSFMAGIGNFFGRFFSHNSASTTPDGMEPGDFGSSTGPFGNGFGTSTRPEFSTTTRQFMGNISSVSSSSFVLEGMLSKGGRGTTTATTTFTVYFNSDTQFASGTSASLIAGTKVLGSGTINDDGSSITATRIHINPANTARQNKEKPRMTASSTRPEMGERPTSTPSGMPPRGGSGRPGKK